ncbi:hypothetical protein Y032_0798g2408 [Ancylostoma ceylanicum]|uniref:Uncharacterized protein n=1 Tax=Ancylostoma ceylanicum TaxID=53326 RepID=A0A016WEC4_9BILA|nr:hypothetical protein Y032_0798g2408 [Ancylostoma ceylanicum]
MLIEMFMLTKTPISPTLLLSQVPRNSSSPVSKVAFSRRCLLVSKKRKKERKSSSENNASSSSSSSESSVSEKTKMQVLPIAAKKTHICGHVGVKLKSQECNSERNTTKVEIRIMPGAVVKQRRQPPWYSVRILEEERPDLAGANGKINLEKDEAALMDMFIRRKSDLQTGDLIITDDNLDEENRRFNRYEVQLKYNEGRYTALYLISRQICANNETVEKNTLFAMKTSIRPYSVNIILRMKSVESYDVDELSARESRDGKEAFRASTFWKTQLITLGHKL